MGNLKDIEPDILVLRSRKQVDRIVRWVGKDKQRFAALMKLYLSRPGGQARRGGQVLDGDAGQDDKITGMLHGWLRIVSSNTRILPRPG